MTTLLKDFLPGYLAEADEHLSLAKENLLSLEERLRAGETHPRAVRDLFRSLHTLKGLSAMIGVEPVVEIAHQMEGVFRALEREGGRLSLGAIETLIAGLAAIEERVGALSAGRPVAKAPDQLLRRLSGLTAESSGDVSAEILRGLEPELLTQLSAADVEQLRLAIGKTGRAVRLDFAPSAERSAAGTNITSVRRRAAEVGEIVKVIPTSAEPTSAHPSGLVFVLLLATAASDAELLQALMLPRESLRDITMVDAKPGIFSDEPEPSIEEGDRLMGGFVRVSVAKLDETMERLSALIVDRFKMARAVTDLATRGADVRALSAVLSENSRHLRDLRGSIMKTRLVAVEELLRPLPLLVRGAAKATGKKVNLETKVAGVELDKAVAERLFPTLVHLVRNAVDHAIEHPAARIEAGKPPHGSIEIVARSLANNQLELTVRDDGHGIDRRKVAAKARREIPSSDADLLDLISLPGLSTRDTATSTSGRGMGMDIVRRIVSGELRGHLSLKTEEKRGTTFTLCVPLSLKIVDAFSLSCAGQLFVVPVSSVDDILEIDVKDVLAAPAPGRTHALRVLRRAGSQIPLVSLSHALEMPPISVLRPKAIVVSRAGQKVAFEVDQLYGQHEVVVRPLEDPLVSVFGVAGSTDLGDGRPVLVLDLMALGARAIAEAA
ncbi:MAG TPA: chemotaxis protein CheW [Polyangiaceae bacterium]|nr:chemotaxis protein CheW [Polyangiaceae bacterium]